MLMHGLDDLGCRDRPCARETLQKRCKAKEMIAMAVGDIDRGEVLAARDDPIQQSLRLLGREKGVHENGVALTVDERRRICHPHQFFLAGWQIATETRALYREYIPLKTIVSSVGCTHRQVLWLVVRHSQCRSAWARGRTHQPLATTPQHHSAEGTISDQMSPRQAIVSSAARWLGRRRCTG